MRLGPWLQIVFDKIDGPKEYSDSSGKYIDENTQNEGIANVIQAPPLCECMIGHCGLNVASGDSPPMVGCDELGVVGELSVGGCLRGAVSGDLGDGGDGLVVCEPNVFKHLVDNENITRRRR